MACLRLAEFPYARVVTMGCQVTTSKKSKLPLPRAHTPAGSESGLPSASAYPLILSEGFPLVLAKLVAKIQKVGLHVYTPVC